MRFALMIEPQQGLSYVQQLELARAAASSGFESLFRSDHFARFHGRGSGLPTDAWTVVGGLAREVPALKLGVLVSPVTFRMPGTFANVIGTVAEMSNNRIEVGLGIGWLRDEHVALGIPFPPADSRYRLLADTLARLRELGTSPRAPGVSGRTDSTVFGPSRPLPSLIVGGYGNTRSIDIAARYADEYNVILNENTDIPRLRRNLAAAAGREGREPPTLSALSGVVVGETHSEVQRRLATLREAIGGGDRASAWVNSRLGYWLVGTHDAVRDRVRQLSNSGIDRVVLQDFLPHDLEHIAEAGRVLYST